MYDGGFFFSLAVYKRPLSCSCHPHRDRSEFSSAVDVAFNADDNSCLSEDLNMMTGSDVTFCFWRRSVTGFGV